MRGRFIGRGLLRLLVFRLWMVWGLGFGTWVYDYFVFWFGLLGSRSWFFGVGLVLSTVFAGLVV